MCARKRCVGVEGVANLGSDGWGDSLQTKISHLVAVLNLLPVRDDLLFPDFRFLEKLLVFPHFQLLALDIIPHTLPQRGSLCFLAPLHSGRRGESGSVGSWGVVARSDLRASSLLRAAVEDRMQGVAGMVGRPCTKVSGIRWVVLHRLHSKTCFRAHRHLFQLCCCMFLFWCGDPASYFVGDIIFLRARSRSSFFFQASHGSLSVACLADWDFPLSAQPALSWICCSLAFFFLLFLRLVLSPRIGNAKARKNAFAELFARLRRSAQSGTR